MTAQNHTATGIPVTGTPRTIRTDTIGACTLRLVATGKSFVGLLLTKGKEIARVHGEDAEALWQELRSLAYTAGDNYFGYDGAVTRFLRHFPEGFRSEPFEARERRYKWKAKCRLDEQVPLEHALTGTGFGAAVLRAYQATDLLYPHEKTGLRALLLGPDADRFIQAAARFATGDIAAALAVMNRVLARYDGARWTVVTYLPFLWRPEAHMFLKPVVTRNYAERVGHAFAHTYHPTPDAEVYASLLDLVATTRDKVRHLKPCDNIDVQSFIWVVGSYGEEGADGKASGMGQGSQFICQGNDEDIAQTPE